MSNKHSAFPLKHTVHAISLACVAMGIPKLAQAADASTDTTPVLPPIQVVGTTPLPGSGVPVDKVPGNVQVFSGNDVTDQGKSNIADFLEQDANGVNISQAQGNPYQADISFRGFTASPVLGTPQGLSVFMDGVRINEPFGDIVNWDLIPPGAISSIQLMPGSNPVFGLNTLGGALAINTKDGVHNPGGQIDVSGGSFGRKTAQLQLGGSNGTVDYFVAANASNDDGWAAHNASRVRQFFGKLGWSGETTSLHLITNLADNTLNGTQTIPLSFSNDIRQAYTWPDTNINRLSFFNLEGSHFINDTLTLDGNVYYRKYHNENVSSNVNNDFGEIDPDTGLPNTIPANNTRSLIDQEGYGGTLQLTAKGHLAGQPNQLVLGGSADIGRAPFSQFSQDATFTDDRGTIPLDDYTQVTDALTRNRYEGLFVSDSFDFAPRWTLTASGRFNYAKIDIDDLSGSQPLLNGSHSYSRFNPAIGINFSPVEKSTLYATYSEGMRAPTAIELACADPDSPCSLPNDFLADPDLKMIVSHTYETGARGHYGSNTTWSIALYRTDLDNDIGFVSSGGTAINSGYFQNIGKTRRQGLELAGSTTVGPFSFNAAYSYIDATYLSSFTENSPSNSSADANGAIQVNSGNHIPGIPRQTLKLGVDYHFATQWEVAASGILRSDVFARGDENNQDIHGTVPGYAVLNLDMHYRPTRSLDVYLLVDNVFNRQYANFGVLGANAFTGPGNGFDGANSVNEQFRGYGAPRGVWVGMNYNFAL
ncbi:TonB-dependent receptor [Silvimonas amylolytica]|uniref:TonB-dependent receptor n=1 Tax=Silvimonas amylolytica TaxID=449663 RepID=UPI0016657113|nr:TonB-dependent receptor [Silvimonas amylolytica]